MGGSWKRERCSGEAQGDAANVLKMENLQSESEEEGKFLEIAHMLFLFFKIVLKSQSGVLIPFLVSKDSPVLISMLFLRCFEAT